MFEVSNSIKVGEFQKIHDFSCRILETTGMKFVSSEILNALEKNGSKINRSNNIAYIPQKLIEEKLTEFKDEIKSGRKQLMRNGGVSYNVGNKIFCKFGSIAPRFFNWDTQKEREATEEDLVNAIRLGQAIDEIGMVGCPMYAKVVSGKRIDPNFTPIVNAMLLAKNTTKLGNSEVNSPKQLKYLIEMSLVIRGSLEEYRENPCFLTAKESISPLVLDENACEVLIALARNKLPATMIPMPIMGATVPVTIAGAVAVTNAEVLATMTAIRCVVPDAMVGGGSMASYMDMSGKGIKFNVIDAIKVDMILSQLYDAYYELDYGYGIYSADAKSLGCEILIDRVMKILGAFFVKKFNYAVGQYDQGMVFSPELALVEVEIIKALHEMYKEFGTDGLNNKLLDIIQNVGPGGSFLGEKHTLNNFRRTLRSSVLEGIFNIKNHRNIGSIYERANTMYKNILKNTEHCRLPADKEREIDKIVSAAYRDIVSQDW